LFRNHFASININGVLLHMTNQHDAYLTPREEMDMLNEQLVLVL